MAKRRQGRAGERGRDRGARGMARRARVELGHGRLEQALTLARQALDLDAHEPRALAALGAAYFARGDAARAAEALLQALRFGELTAPDENRLGLALQALARHELAAQAFERAAEKAIEDADLPYNAGCAWLAAGEPERAAQALREALERRPDDPEVLGNLGVALRRTGRVREAADVLREALRIAPADAGLKNNLGNVLKSLGEVDDAIDVLRGAATQAPGNARLENNLGTALRAAGRTDDAIEAYRAAVRFSPELAEAHQNLGNALVDVGEIDDAVACLRRACDLAPESAVCAYNLGCALLERRDPGGAREAFARALELGGLEAQARVNLGRVDEIEGRRSAALDEWRRAADAAPRLARPRYLLARAGELERADALEALVSDESAPPDDRVEAHFGLALWHERAQRVEPAFDHFAAGNRLKRERVRRFDSVAHGALVERLTRTFDAGLFARVPGAHASEAPVLVVGMPRSGTTLVEALLARHPLIAPRGELETIGRLAQAWNGRAPGWPEVAAEIPLDERRASAERYLAALAIGSNERRAVDKLPANFLNLGLVATLFSNARVIHCRRDPLDMCTSIWRQLFERDRVAYGYDFDDMAAYHRAYRRLMEHWRDVLPLRTIDLDYETLVGDVEGTARRLVEFVGLDWDERCLTPEAASHPVFTASAWRVRSAVDTSAVGRAAAFGARLDPLRAALEA